MTLFEVLIDNIDDLLENLNLGSVNLALAELYQEIEQYIFMVSEADGIGVLEIPAQRYEQEVCNRPGGKLLFKDSLYKRNGPVGWCMRG